MSTDLINIYQDTLHYSESMGFDKQGITTKHTFNDIKKYNSCNIDNIVVQNLDTISALVEWSEYKCAVLNMASYKRPGGGVARGAKAQEESLFRCSNLTHIISNDNYPLNTDECLTDIS